jgi:hypothetical protein
MGLMGLKVLFTFHPKRIFYHFFGVLFFTAKRVFDHFWGVTSNFQILSSNFSLVLHQFPEHPFSVGRLKNQEVIPFVLRT